MKAPIIPLALTLLVAFFVVTPIAFLVFGMFWTAPPGRPGQFTTSFVTRAFSAGQALPLLANTLIFAMGSTVLTLLLATSFVFIAYRTDTPGARIFETLPIIPLVFPSMLIDIAWSFLLSPRTGLINTFIMKLFGLSEAPFNIFSLEGMIWSQGLSLTPMAYLLLAGSFRNMDATMEESARVSGAGYRSIVFTVTLPLMLPAVLSTAILLFMIGIQSFETPVFLGMPGGVYVYMSVIYETILIRPSPEWGLASAQAFVFLLLGSVTIAAYLYATRRLQKFVTVTGKGYRPKVISLGRWKYLALAFIVVYLLLAIVLPIFIVTLVSLLPYYSPTSPDFLKEFTLNYYFEAVKTPLVQRSMINSIGIATIVAPLSIGLATTVAYMAVKSKIKGRRVLEVVTLLPNAYPGLVYALALIWTFLSIPLTRPFYGTMVIMMAAYIIHFIPYSVRIVTNSMVQIHSELEEAARVTGSSWLNMFSNVVLPLLKPSLLNGLMYVFIQAYRQLGAAVLLVVPGTYVLPVVILTYWNDGQIGFMSAIVILYGGIVAAIMIAGRILLKIRPG